MFSDRLSSTLSRLSVRLTLWHSALFIGSALVLLAVNYVLLKTRVETAERDAVDFRLNQYLREYQNRALPGVRRTAALRKGRSQNAFFVRVADAKNQTIFIRDRQDWVEFGPERLSKEPLPEKGKRIWRTLRSASGTELLLGAERLPDGGLLEVGKSTEELQKVLSTYRRMSMLTLLVFIPANFAGGAFLASRALRPVQHLTVGAKKIVETGRFDSRVPSPGSGDELDALVRVFNQMLGRIDTLLCNTRECLDNVAHDLRTPLTRLRVKVQSALEVSLKTSTPQLDLNRDLLTKALADCIEETDRVAAMLNTLMEIAEAKTGLIRLEPVQVCLAEILSYTIEGYAELSEERGVTITMDVSPRIHVRADPTALSRAFANLLDNAIKYTPAAGCIRITAETCDDIVEIRFADTGVGISAQDLPLIWERLFRGNTSHSKRGLGLGLSFVRAIIMAHGGSVVAQSKPGHGTTVKVTLLTG